MFVGATCVELYQLGFLNLYMIFKKNKTIQTSSSYIEFFGSRYQSNVHNKNYNRIQKYVVNHLMKFVCSSAQHVLSYINWSFLIYICFAKKKKSKHLHPISSVLDRVINRMFTTKTIIVYKSMLLIIWCNWFVRRRNMCWVISTGVF